MIFHVKLLYPTLMLLNLLGASWSGQFTAKMFLQNNLIKKVCDEISSDEWSKFVRHVEKEEEKFRTRDHILDTEIEPLMIALADDDDSDVEYIAEDCGVPNEY